MERGKLDAGEVRGIKKEYQKEMRRGQTERKGEQERLLCFCQQINQQATPSARQSVSQTEIQPPQHPVVHCAVCHKNTHAVRTHIYTHPVSPDDYHYPGKYIWP